jgi:hypothetical protein
MVTSAGLPGVNLTESLADNQRWLSLVARASDTIAVGTHRANVITQQYAAQSSGDCGDSSPASGALSTGKCLLVDGCTKASEVYTPDLYLCPLPCRVQGHQQEAGIADVV